MKKISFALLLSLAAIGCAYAQSTPFLISPLAPSTADTSQQMAEDITPGCVGCVGIGITGTVLGGALPGALTVANYGYATYPTPETPLVEMIAINFISTGLTGISDYAMLAIRAGDAIPGGGPLADFSVDKNGLVGVGNVATKDNNGNITAHLYVTDPNIDNLPLVAAYTNINKPAMIIDQNGLVGIGSYPTVGSPAGTGIGAFAVPGNGNTNAHLYITDANGDGYPLLAIYNNAGASPLFVTNAGNVGIGTATPATPLDVSGNATFENDIAVTGNAAITGNTTMGGTLDVSGLASFTSAKAAYYFSAGRSIIAGANSLPTYSDAQLIVQTSGGRGGLDLVSDGYAGWTNALSFKNVSGDTRHFMFDDNSTSGATAGDMVIYPGYGGGAKNILDILGKVEIGIVPAITPTTPLDNDYSLYVQKGVIAEKFKCALTTGSDWSDYVFDKNYKLKPLSEVETYIKTNKHLPDVPSAEEVVCDGIDMASMDATLLKKIEELTLYMLKQQQQIESLQSQLSKTSK